MSDKEDSSCTEVGQDDDLAAIPKSCINNIVKSILTEQASSTASRRRVSCEARESLAVYAAVFIRSITDRASGVCARQSKKMIGPEHILEALREDGHSGISAECECTAEEGLAKSKAAKKRRISNRLESLGIPEEELLRQQQMLFAKAREAMELTAEDVGTLQSNIDQSKSTSLALAAEDDDDDFDI